MSSYTKQVEEVGSIVFEPIRIIVSELNHFSVSCVLICMIRKMLVTHCPLLDQFQPLGEGGEHLQEVVPQHGRDEHI